jgi:hypothetical protein
MPILTFVPRSAPLQPPEPAARLVDRLGAVANEDHIVILGGGDPELMCDLLRAGAPRVTHLCAHERPEAGSASLVIIPRVASLDWLASALPAVRRLLAADGRVVVFAGGSGAAQTQVRRMLTLHGFVPTRASQRTDPRVLSAEVPMFGIRQAI